MVCLTFKLPSARFYRKPFTLKRRRFDVSLLRPSPGMSAQERDSVLERVKSFQSSVASALELESTLLEGEEKETEELPSVEDQWGRLRDSLIQASHQHLGYARRCQTDWFTSNQMVLAPLIQERRLCYNRWVASQLACDCASFKVARSKARAAVRRAKNEWLADVAQRAESHSAGHGGTVWSAVRSIQRCFHGLQSMPSSALKNEDGQLCMSAEEISARWQRHFTKVLNIESAYSSSGIDSLRVRPVRDELADLPTEEDLARAVARLCNNKAPGESGILPEMVRYAGLEFFTALLSLVHRVWLDGCVPQAWRDAELVPIPKKGDLSSCDNWRGIALLDVVGKVVGRVIQTRLQVLAEAELSDSQCGFRQGRSCTDQIFSVNQFIEKLFEHRTPGFLVFIDLRKAYDSVSRGALWHGLQVLGVPLSLVQLIASFHTGMSAKVRVGNSFTGQIAVNNGLRQGCSMAPVLFNLFFALVLEKWRMEMAEVYPDHEVAFRLNINGNLFNRPRSAHQQSAAPDLEFADDAVLITQSHHAAHVALATFVAVASSFGLSVNFIKTKVMSAGAGLSVVDHQPIFVSGQVVEHVKSFVYLGSLLSPDARFSAEIDRRVASASRVFGALQCVFRDRNLSLRTKRLIYSACVVSTLLYGAECWAILKRDETRLDAFHHRCLRAILGVSRWDQQLHHVSNADLRQRWGDVGLISDTVRKRRLQWLGHVARMPADRLPKQLLFGWLPQPRPAHGPRLRWKDRVSADLQQLEVKRWFEVAQDRGEWRSICRTLIDTSSAPDSAFCPVCARTFKSRSGLARHKCAAARQLPVALQPGARQCLTCERWFRSAGGLAVHKCREVFSESVVPDQTPVTVNRNPVTNLQCCVFHCELCDRCFKSCAGFHRHNCHRGQRPTSRDAFEHCCTTCNRRFRRRCDLTRHKCRDV